MARIKQLSPHVVNKIAAGEVIERPASVVKELVENAIDAEATSITIELKEGGKKLIRVTDDGAGMGREDIALAFHGHATSKLTDPDELFHITTMGFRGEALASVGSISQAGIVSRPDDEIGGWEISCDGGALGEVRQKGCPRGTSVYVRNLFFNTPVRMKFLKSDSTELSHTVSAVTRIALAHCHIRFELIHNDRRVFLLDPHMALIDRLRHFYGDEIADSLLLIESHTNKIHVSGYVAAPPVSRRDTKMQLLFLNSRPIRERVIFAAIKSAFDGLLVSGRQPVAFIFVDIDPREVDVNVHPTKIEVRFRDASALHAQVRATLKDILAGVEAARMSGDAGKEEAGETAPQKMPASGAPRFGSGHSKTQGTRQAIRDFFAHRANRRQQPHLPFDGHEAPAKSVIPAARPAPAFASETGPAFFQAHDSYIVVETPEGLEIIDQHALHEKIIYEKLLAREAGGADARQRMLIPPTVELSAAQWVERERITAALGEVGFEVEEFGGRSLAVRAVPEALVGADIAALVKDMSDEISARGASARMEEIRDALRKTAACHAALKAGEPLSARSIADLLEQREKMREKYSCPHGRPIALRFTLDELEKRFHRK